MPLDIQATAFQMRVWEALRKIPYGETVSYTDIAEKLGNKNAVRAVATACASNRVALVIPCHRVIGKNGDLSGYRWGVERKKANLGKGKTIIYLPAKYAKGRRKKNKIIFVLFAYLAGNKS